MSTQADFLAEIGWFVGEDKDIVFTIINHITLLPENIAGWTLKFDFSENKFGTRIFQKTTGAGIVLSDPGGGICTVSVATADTVDLTPGLYYYTLRRTNAGEFAEIAYGEVELLDTWTEYV